jgi:probable rRNA maturation factor
MELTVQDVSGYDGVPEDATISGWITAALESKDVSLTVRIVDDTEMAELNQQYRHKSGATNVLSFPFENPPGVETDILGDIVICAPVVDREAKEQGKNLLSHWAHMVVHGILHLRGFDHETDEQAAEMERLETDILTSLGFPAPYAVA